MKKKNHNRMYISDLFVSFSAVYSCYRNHNCERDQPNSVVE